MRLEARRQTLLLAVRAVPDLPLDGDDHALVHLVADDSCQNLDFRHGQSLTPFSRSTVFTRARSPRSGRILLPDSPCPIEDWMRRRNTWSSRSSARLRKSSTGSS